MARTTGPLLVAPDLRGTDYARAHSDATDRWFRDVFHQALGEPSGLALLAVGGYGRRELCPYSDIDVILIHDDLDHYAEVAEALWYPVWDRGLKMGYAVVTEEQARVLAATELNWATAFLAGRHLAGDPEQSVRFRRLTTEVWAEHGERLLGELADSVHARHEQYGDVAFHIEPNLKEGRGGLRDVHALGWANQVRPGFVDDVLEGVGDGAGGAIDAEAEILLTARVELHRLSGRAGDMLSLEAQEDVARELGDRNGNDLLTRVALAGRRIAWRSDEAWSRWERAKGRIVYSPLTAEPVATEFGLVNGYLELSRRVDVANDPMVLLRLAATSARTKRTIGRASLARLRDHGPPLPEPWPAEARQLFAEMLLAGRNAISVIEDLDQFGLMTRLLPEWEQVRCRPQRNVMHTFTVDRHLCEAAANAARLAHRVARPDLLVVGALLHDIGKGYPGGDHTEVGMDVIPTIASRMGYPDDEVAVLVDLCRHHLLLPDYATRRDLADPGTIGAVAAAVDSVEFLDLLAALTEADSIATGPATWGSWKAGLLAELVKRTTFVLDGGAPTEAAIPEFPPQEILDLMARRETVLRGEGSTLVVVAPDRQALFSNIAGVLAMNGLDVLDAVAFSADGMATCRFTMQPPATGVVDWDKVVSLAERAIDGRLALTARVRQRAQAYARYQRRLAAAPPRRDVVIDNQVSEAATVVEVHAGDTVGLLFWITQALAELHLDIRRAKIQTFGPQAVDSFYLLDAEGRKLSDPDLLNELALAIRSAVGQDSA